MKNIAADKVFQEQKQFFSSGTTLSVEFRRRRLKELKGMIRENEDALIAAVREDTGRCEMEVYVSEIYTVLSDIDLALKKLPAWTKPQRQKTPMMMKPGKSCTLFEPYGVVLIIAPWNYPFQLMMCPLVGALAAGNCAVVKPSEYAPRTAGTVTRLLNECFENNFIYSAPGGPETARALLDMEFDYIFFTGGREIGRLVMQAAAKNLVPVALELGGKCPCIVTGDADIKTAAKRITWGKFFNAGQTCLAPDFVLAQETIKERLENHMRDALQEFYGQDPSLSPDYGRIINDKHFDRLLELLGEERASHYAMDRDHLYFPPVVLGTIQDNDRLMQEEIFGPVLPVKGCNSFSDAVNEVRRRPKPLSVYVFTSNEKHIRRLVRETSSGGVTVNDVLIQAASPYLPFGGVGESGMGRYRGRASFTTFSNQKSLFRRGTRPDWSFRYPPYRQKIKTLRKLLNFFNHVRF